MSAYMWAQTPAPDQESESGPDGVRSKPQIMDYVKGSFAALDRTVAATNESNMVKPLAIPIRQKTRIQLAVDAVAHANDHCGQMVEYPRRSSAPVAQNGYRPPASRRGTPKAATQPTRSLGWQ